ncbi:hypothetical protein ACWGLF_29600 [Streptomyces puniciscabiei]
MRGGTLSGRTAEFEERFGTVADLLTGAELSDVRRVLPVVRDGLRSDPSACPGPGRAAGSAGGTPPAESGATRRVIRPDEGPFGPERWDIRVA